VALEKYAFTFTGLGSYNAADQTYGSVLGVKFLSKFHSSGSIVRFREIDSDFKHIWILWADMRNDGTADADGGLRKKKFGLMMPISNNYSVTMEFVDSEEPDGSPVKFADLKVGEDLDIWELDATLEPETQAPWSALPLGSNADSNTLFHNWEDKAGSFIVIDTSKFWNVNTEANLGRTGRIGGGRTDLQDYFAVGHGFPIMMDNYWIEAMPSYKTVQHPYMPHPQQMDFIQDASEVKRNQPDVFGGTNRLYLDDVSEWDDSGIGRIVAVEGAGQTKVTYTWYYAWNGRNTTDNYLDNVYVDIVGGLNGVPTKTAAERLIAANNIKASQQNGSGSRAIFDLEDYDSVTAYNSYAPLSGMRFMMRISGKVENENSGTWFESEKFRFFNMLPLTKNWLGKSQFTGISSFKNVPMTKTMNINGSGVTGNPNWTHNNQNFDSYGSVVNAKNSTMYSAVVKTQKAAGMGVGGNGQTFTYQIGPDGRIELRPGYNSFRSFDRTVLNISNMNTSIQQRVTHVRIYFNDSKSFCDYPASTGTTENIRWKIMDMPEVGTKAEAEYIAKQEYLKAKKAPISLKAKVVRGTQSNDVMLDDARYGYIADPQRTVYGQHPHFMMGRMNNNFFSGSVNALDGQINNTNTPFIGASNRDASVVNASNEITWAGNNYWYGANSIANAIEIVYVPQGLPKYSMTTGNQLRFILSVDGKRLGTSSATTIEDAADKARFVLTVIDPIFRDNASRNTAFVNSFGLDSNGDPNLLGEAEWFGACNRGDLNHIAAVTAAGQGHDSSNDFWTQTISYGSLDNGFLEVDLPLTYAWGTNIVNKIIVSINREYLESLVRMRCGDTLGDVLQPAHGVPVESAPTNYLTLKTTGTYNDKSIFPLGCRFYDEFGSGTRDRSLWYAPRLIINDDINFRTSTAVQFSDSAYGFTNKPMIINNVQWRINPNQHEEVTLGLTTDESHFLSNLGSMFLTPPIVNDPKPSPAGTGGTSGRGDGDDDDEPVPPGGDKGGNPSKPNPFPDIFPPGTKGSQTDYITANTMGINQVSKGIMGRIKKKMQVPMGNSDWGLLGQDRPLPAGIETSVLVSNDGVFTPSGGSSALSETGVSLPGRTFAIGDSEQAEVSEVSGIQIVPNNVINNSVSIMAKVDTTIHSESAKVNAGPLGLIPDGIRSIITETEDTFAKIYTTVKVVETGLSKTETLVIPTKQNGLSHNLFNQKVEGADIAGNHLEITIRRVAGEGGDTANLESVKLTSISVTMKTGANMVDGPGEVFDTNVVSR